LGCSLRLPQALFADVLVNLAHIEANESADFVEGDFPINAPLANRPFGYAEGLCNLFGCGARYLFYHLCFQGDKAP
jgi:hypothetical protein